MTFTNNFVFFIWLFVNFLKLGHGFYFNYQVCKNFYFIFLIFIKNSNLTKLNFHFIKIVSYHHGLNLIFIIHYIFRIFFIILVLDFLFNYYYFNSTILILLFPIKYDHQ